MIERYSQPEIADIWSDKSKFEFYLKVEIALLKALEEEKIIPPNTAKTIESSAKVNPNRIDELERETKHDVIAFCTSITENLPKEIAKFFHFGCTSSDIIDTATNLQIKQSLKLILPKLKNVVQTLDALAAEHKGTIAMGRSHGINAEPISFGTKFLSFKAEFDRRYSELKNFAENEISGQLSGAVGNYTVLTPQVEKIAINSLGLEVEPLSTQVIPRDRILKLISITAMIASAIERVAVEIRHLHHSDINELAEGFSKGQKGSSTMPHKKNPISGENLSGLVRVIRSHLLIAHENNALWHERDISHSSAERMMLPDNLGLTFYCLKRLDSTLNNLVIHKSNIENKVLNNFNYLSSYILHKLLLTSNVTREELYKDVQEAFFSAKSAEDLIKKIKQLPSAQDTDWSYLTALDINGLKKIYFKHLDEVYSRNKKASSTEEAYSKDDN